MKLTLDDIRGSLDGTIPPILATCALDGTPNVSYLSQMEYVDREHVALSFQFFNKTRANILAHPYATAYVTDSTSAQAYRVALQYLNTATEGPLFERMRARLAGIASQTGMQGIFHLQGSDIYRVLAIEPVPGPVLPIPPRCVDLLGCLRTSTQALGACTDLESLLDECLRLLEQVFQMPHGMILLLDARRDTLYTVASRGYATSGIGSEIALGSGVIGVAAAQRVPIRITFMTSEYSYGRAMRASAIDAGLTEAQPEIPFPGLAEPRSQVAVPIMGGPRLLGVLYADSMEDYRFGHAEEDALVVLASQLGSAILTLGEDSEGDAQAATAALPPQTADARPLCLHHYPENDSVFVDDHYLIKGVAGAVFWKLVSEHARTGRAEFTNRELRLDPAIRLPEIDDNLEARLILLTRRLGERCEGIRIEKTGRGRFRLCVSRPLRLQQTAAA